MSVKIGNIKNQFIASVESSISEVKERMSANILNIELAFLYQNKIYGKEAYDVQNLFSELSENIDDVLNEYKTNCIASITDLLDKINYDHYDSDSH